jgi:hypothetical protein
MPVASAIGFARYFQVHSSLTPASPSVEGARDFVMKAIASHGDLLQSD